MKSNRTATIVTVRKIDFSPELDTLPDWYAENHPDKEMPSMWRMGDTWGYVPLPDGTIYLLCEEGVGYPSRSEEGQEKPLTFDVHARWDRTSELTDEERAKGQTRWSGSMFPLAQLCLSAEEIKALPVSEEVNLADFIRGFGGRLENNYHLNRAAIELRLGGAE